jgi:hypothetical protein
LERGTERSRDWDRDIDSEPCTPTTRYRAANRSVHSSLGPRLATSMGGDMYRDGDLPPTAPRLRSTRLTPGQLPSIPSSSTLADRSRTFTLPISATICDRERLVPLSSTSLGRQTSQSNASPEHPRLSLANVQLHPSNPFTRGFTEVEDNNTRGNTSVTSGGALRSRLSLDGGSSGGRRSVDGYAGDQVSG